MTLAPAHSAVKRRTGLLSFAAAAVITLLAGCSSAPVQREGANPPPACAPVKPCPACASCPAPSQTPPQESAAPYQVSPWSALPGWQDDEISHAWSAFRTSCRTLERQASWQRACQASQQLGDAPTPLQTRNFFEQHFTPWSLVNPDGTQSGLITGYYEPLIKGSRSRSERYRWPIHATPQDMLTIDLSTVYPDLKNYRLRGRLVGNKVVPYWTREELARQGDRLPASTLLWAADPIDLFFLQVQGSGRVELPDGSRVRIGYADQNGHPYQSIGRWLIQQGELTLEKASMEGIRDWARRNPERLQELLNNNPSYVFFRELPASQDGPLGALGVPLTNARSIAVDPRYVPLGAPVFLATTHPNSDRPLNRLMMAQDTGGAIKGVVRADFFWGFGPEAGAQAGKMRQQGRMWVLLPTGMPPPGATN